MKENTLYWIPFKHCLLYVYKIEGEQMYFTSTRFLKDLFTTLLHSTCNAEYFENTYIFIEIKSPKLLSKKNLTKKWQVISDRKEPSSIPFYGDVGVSSAKCTDIGNHFDKYKNW